MRGLWKEFALNRKAPATATSKTLTSRKCSMHVLKFDRRRKAVIIICPLTWYFMTRNHKLIWVVCLPIISESKSSYCALSHDRISKNSLNIFIHPTQEMKKKKAITKLYMYISFQCPIIQILSYYRYIRTCIQSKLERHFVYGCVDSPWIYKAHIVIYWNLKIISNSGLR